MCSSASSDSFAFSASGDLGLTAQNHACACATDTHSATPETHTAQEAAGEVVRLHYFVDGMTCSHCVSSVTDEVSAIDGVHSVSVDLHVGGTSQIMVVSADPIPAEIISTAVTEAGYTLVSGQR